MLAWRSTRKYRSGLSVDWTKVFALLIALLWPGVYGAGLRAQHLWWDQAGQTGATCLYGEVTVLATHPSIYYCGANWHPGEPAGGYCGIQHNGPTERRTIFSVWDTSPALHPSVTQADPQTVFNRFGGEGEGGHTHMLWDWQPEETFRFFVRKTPGTTPGTTDARYYVFDRRQNRWLHSATIRSPDGGQPSVATIGGGGLASFLENFTGKDPAVPRLALYRLWLGSGPAALCCLTHARGDGVWGTLHDAYFLAVGDRMGLDATFARLTAKYGRADFGGSGKIPPPITAQPVPAETVKALDDLPQAGEVKAKP